MGIHCANASTSNFQQHFPTDGKKRMINKDLENYFLITYVAYRGAPDFSYVFCKNWSIPIIRIFNADLLKELHQVG